MGKGLDQERENRSMAHLQETYQQIDIPPRLDGVIGEAIKRGKREMKKKSLRRKFVKGISTMVAAAFFLFFIGVNTIPAFADSVSAVPLVGNLVKVLQFEKGLGSGGEITDGTKVQIGELEKQGKRESMTINFMLEGNPALIANYFEVSYSEYPYSMLFSIPGAREFSYGDVFQGLSDSELVQDVYRLITLDDSMQRFVVVFKQAVEFEVLEMADPARIVVNLKEKTPAAAAVPVWSMRSASYPFGEEVGVAEEMLRWEADSRAVRMLKDSTGTYFVEEGYYQTEQEALQRMEELAGQLPEIKFYLEKRGAGDIPGAI